MRPSHVLVGVTGSVATIKLPEIVHGLLASGVEVKVVATTAAAHFIKHDEVAPVAVLTDADEWAAWRTMGDPVLHIELRRWADVLLIAPLDANTLAKLAIGLSDNLLTCVVRAWDVARPIIVCPAMNVFMWESPLTAQHLTALEARPYVHVVPPISKRLACGDTGAGAMASVATILEAVSRRIDRPAAPTSDAHEAALSEPACVQQSQ